MSLRKLLIVAGIAIVAACSDNTAPTDGPQLARGGNGGGRWATTETVTTESSATTIDTMGETGAVEDACAVPNGIRHTADAPPLATYDTTVAWVVGTRSSIIIHYLNSKSFLRLRIPAEAVLLDDNGVPVPLGETAHINVKVDTTCFFAEFQPHGSTFDGSGATAELGFSTTYADLSGGSETGLSVMYQPDSDTDWQALPTTFRRQGNWLRATIYHFSNYAVAW